MSLFVIKTSDKKQERRFDRSTVIFKLEFMNKNSAYLQFLKQRDEGNKQVKLPLEYPCPKYILSLQGARSKMSLKLRNLNLQLTTSKTLYISLSVICVMQIMSALQADTYINVQRSTNDRQSAIM